MTKPTTKQATVRDDEPYMAELAKQMDLETRFGFTDAAYKEAAEARAKQRFDPVGDEAREMVFGGSGAVVERVASLQDLGHDLQVLRTAIDLQKPIVDKARGKAFQPICAEAWRSHVGELHQFIHAAEEFIAANASLKAFIAGVLRRGDGAGLQYPLTDFGIDQTIIARVNSAITQLKILSLEYRTEGYVKEMK